MGEIHLSRSNRHRQQLIILEEILRDNPNITATQLIKLFREHYPESKSIVGQLIDLQIEGRVVCKTIKGVNYYSCR